MHMRYLCKIELFTTALMRSLVAAVLLSLVPSYVNADDRLGGDLPPPQSPVVGSSNAAACANSCARNPNCVAWVQVRSQQKCYLKSSVTPAGFNPTCPDNFSCQSGLVSGRAFDSKLGRWCGDKAQGTVLTCQTGNVCMPATTRKCEGWWIFKRCTDLTLVDISVCK